MKVGNIVKWVDDKHVPGIVLDTFTDYETPTLLSFGLIWASRTLTPARL